ncbi:MAG: hypothetical protein AAGK04_09960, partial [Planctomycetota bacterium]
MDRRQPTTLHAALSRLTLLAAAGATLSACIGPRGDPAELVRSDEFTRLTPDAREARQRTDLARRRQQNPPPIIYTAGAGEADESPRDIRATPGAPVFDESRPALPVGQADLIDAKVGDVNGRPIFASAFLEPLDARIAAEAERDPPREWTRNTYSLLSRELFQVVRDELIKAEARASLSEQQQVGLRYFLDEQLNTRIRQGRGSRVEAERALAQSGEAETLDEWIARQEDRSLIQFYIQERIRKGVHVTRRDV